MAHEELVNKAVDILRSSMEYNHLTDQELKENAKNAGDEVLKEFISQYEQEL